LCVPYQKEKSEGGGGEDRHYSKEWMGEMYLLLKKVTVLFKVIKQIFGKMIMKILISNITSFNISYANTIVVTH